MLAATCLARLASRMFALAIMLFAIDRFQSPELAGWLMFAAVAPGLAASPVAGAWLDRIGAPRAIGLDLLASAVLIAAMAIAGDRSRTILLVLAGMYSLTSPLSAAGIRTLLPRLVPVEMLGRANALDTAIYAFTEVIGPALAGLLFAVSGPRPTLLIIAALALLGALCLRRPFPGQATASRRSILNEAAAGVAIVARHPTLRGLVASYGLYQVSWGILLVAVPVMVAHAIDDPPQADNMTGLIWAVSGLAGGAGALLTGYVRISGRERACIVTGTLVTALAIYPVAATAGLAGLAAGVMLVGFFAGPIDVGLLTLRQHRTDPSQLGRVLAVSMSLNTAGLPVGSVLGGILLTHSTQATLIAAAGAAALSALAGQCLIPGRHHRDISPGGTSSGDSSC